MVVYCLVAFTSLACITVFSSSKSAWSSSFLTVSCYGSPLLYVSISSHLKVLHNCNASQQVKGCNKLINGLFFLLTLHIMFYPLIHNISLVSQGDGQTVLSQFYTSGHLLQKFWKSLGSLQPCLPLSKWARLLGFSHPLWAQMLPRIARSAGSALAGYLGE